MENEMFTHNLIKVAFCAMACDLEIDESEIFKVREIAEKDFYFKDYSFTKDINLFEKIFNASGLDFIEKTLNEQIFLNYTESQKIIIIDIAIGIIRADRQILPPEINYINKLIINLKVPSSIISSKFGNWDTLEENSNIILQS